MDIELSWYKIPEDIDESPYKEILSIHEKNRRYNQGNRPIPDVIFTKNQNRLMEYLLDVSNVKVPTEEINERVRSNKNSKILKGTLLLLGEQMEYFWFKNRQKRIGKTNSPCDMYFIKASLCGHLYGGIFLFYRKDYPDRVFIQGITKYIIPTISSILFPEYDKELPRLNSVLGPSIESLTRRLGAKYIYVRPIGKQGSILEKHYGYKKTEEQYEPEDCGIYTGFDSFYVKELPALED